MNFTSRILEGLMARRGVVEPREEIGCWVWRQGLKFLLVCGEIALLRAAADRRAVDYRQRRVGKIDRLIIG